MERPDYIEYDDPGDMNDFVEKEQVRSDVSFFVDRGHTPEEAVAICERIAQRTAFVTIFEDK